MEHLECIDPLAITPETGAFYFDLCDFCYCYHKDGLTLAKLGNS
jgi:hypothetical protein